MPWENIVAIPAKMHAERAEVEKRDGLKALARHIHNELLMSWVTVLPPWRQANLRACCLEKNLYLDVIDPDIPIYEPWAEEKRRANPNHKFYQIYFAPDEVKIDSLNYEIWFLVPQELVPLLEQYLHEYRPLLLSNPANDPGNLFLSPKGEPLTDRRQVTKLISDLTYQYTGRRLAPHQLRHSWTTWLRSQFGADIDLRTVARTLWHAGSIIDPYDRDFGLSAAHGHLQQLRRGTRQESKLLPQKVTEHSATACWDYQPQSRQLSPDRREYCRRCGDLTHVTSDGYCRRCLPGQGFVRKVA